jgi:hypothetical protein
MDPQATDFPNRPSYEGFVVDRNDPENRHRILVRIPGAWDPHGPWVSPVNAGFGGAPNLGRFESPPLGAKVSISFVNGNQENPCYMVGDAPVDGVPLDRDGDPLAVLTDDGDNKVFQDERIRIEVDARPGSYAIRISDLETETDNVIDLDLHSGQVGVTAPLGIRLISTSRIDIDAPMVTIKGRPVIGTGAI